MFSIWQTNLLKYAEEGLVITNTAVIERKDTSLLFDYGLKWKRNDSVETFVGFIRT